VTEALAWTCPKCSAWCWNHHLNCAACGQQKPAPPPAETPSDETRPEPPWRLEERERDTAFIDGTEWTQEQLNRVMNRALRRSLRIIA
jgi:hypothetical protein